MTDLQAQQRAERLVVDWHSRVSVPYGTSLDTSRLATLLAAALLAVQREAREACADLCDSLGADDAKPTDRVIGYEECADAIRGESHE